MASKTGSAAAAGSAAGKKKQAALEISQQIENAITNALASLSIDDRRNRSAVAATSSVPRLNQPSAVKSSSNASTALIEHVSDVYRTLTSQGFVPHDVERALQALPLHSIAVGSALDWLLLHLEKSDLPKQYADQVQTFGEIELRHKGSSFASRDTKNKVEEAEKVSKAAAAAAAAAEAARLAKEKEAAAKAAELEEKNRLEAEEKEKAARRAWILQYAESSSSDEEESVDSAASSKSSVVEDWEVWGDPREVDRRRAERARSALPREDRLELIASELAKTMAGAAKAKASGDKAEQRSFGQMIGQLKREMAELGVTEADLPSLGSSTAPAAAGEAAKIKKERGEGDNDDKQLATCQNNNSRASSPSSSSVSSDSEEEESFGFDIFDSGAVDELESVPGADKRNRCRAKAMAAAAMQQPQPWGTSTTSGGGGGAKKKGGHKTANESAIVVQQPKAALQQACQKNGWAAPRYERLAPGGSRDPSEGGGEYRYSVTIDPGSGAGASAAAGTTKQQVKNQKSGGGSNNKFLKGGTLKRNFILPEARDGWAKIEDAQNAAATLALLVLLKEEDSEFWRLLPMPFSELWLTLEEEGVDLDNEEESEEAAALRESFVKDLIAVKQQEESLEERNLQEEARLAAEHVSWAETLKRKLAQRQQNPKVAAIEAVTSKRMLNDLIAWRNSSNGAEWQEARGNLPASALREQLREKLESQDVLVVSGETGSGKTTQVPQFILECETEAGRGGACSVVCTQPRRIAAISVAERVASERGEPAPGERGSTVGYSVRLDSATNSDTRLLFCTTGILLRRLASDPALSTVTHVVVDEVHERTLQGDFLIALLKDLLVHRRAAGFPLKVILMSATLDSGLLTEYFGGCPVLHAPGRTFPVEQFFLEDAMEVTGYVLAPDAPAALRSGGARRERQRRLENAVGARNRLAVRSGWGDDEADEILNPNYSEEQYEGYSLSVQRNMARVNEDRIDFDLLEDLVGYIHDNEDPGAVLVFLPGMAEISNLHRRLEASRRFAGCWLVPLHSTVAPSDQRKAFKRPPKDVRKIVIATNIAETSLTIEDVVYVVDSGKLKERRHDAARSMSLLVEDWVSVASAKQRRGRAGRVREGVCYGLYSRDRFERRMKPYQTPEMARVPLEELVLQVHLLRVASSAALFASRVLQPPPAKAVDGALRVLREVGALNEAEELTPLGHYLAQLPVDARVGKLLLFAASLGCLAPALTIAACLSHKPPFATGLAAADGSEKARAALAAAESGTIAAGQQSDHLIMAAAVDGWLLSRRKNNGVGGGRKAATEFSRKFCLSEQTLEMLSDMRGQFASMLAEIGFLSTDKSNSRSISGASGTGQQRVPWFDDPSLPCNQYAQHPAVLKAVLFAALYPNIAAMDDGDTGPGRRPHWHDGTGHVAIHPGSICSDLDSARFHRPFLTYLEKVRTSQVFLRDCTVVSPAAILLFGGQLEVDHAAGRVLIDNWLRVKVPAKTAALVRKLREALEALLEKKVKEPKRDMGDAGGAGVVAAIVGLLDFEEAAQAWT